MPRQVATPRLTLEQVLGQRIRDARRQAGFRNTEQLAVKLGVGARTVQRWETGRSEPTISRIREIAATTGKPLSFFVANLEREA